MKVPRVPVADDSMTGDKPTYRDLWRRIRDALPKKGRGTEDAGGEPPNLPKELRGGPAQPVRALREVLPAVGGQCRSTRQRPDAARLHRRLQQHQRLQARLRLRRRLGEADWGRRQRSSCRAHCRIFSNEENGQWRAAPEHDPRGQRAARLGRGDERRIQEDRRRARSRSGSGVPRALSRPRRRGPDRRGPAPRGHEHRRQAGQARRGRPLRRLRLDADRRLGRQHRHPHPRRPGVRDAAPLRAGRRTRPSADELRRERATGSSSRSTPRCTAFRSLHPLHRPTPTPKPAPIPTESEPWTSGSTARSRSLA